MAIWGMLATGAEPSHASVPATLAVQGERPLSGWVRLALWVGAALSFAASALVVSHDELSADWFSDEMWRANFVHSPRWWDLYLSWDTPTPPGFVMLFRVLDWFVPTGPTALRLGTLVTLVVTLLLTFWLLLAILERSPLRFGRPRERGGSSDSGPGLLNGGSVQPAHQRASMQIAAFAACLVTPLLSAAGIHRTFAPYFLETALAAALVLGCVLLDRHRLAWPALLAVIVVTPTFAIGALFFLPAAAIYVLLWCWRQPDRVRRLAWSVSAIALSAVEAMVVDRYVYRPVRKDTIADYWAFAALKGQPDRFGDLLADTWHQLLDGLLLWAHPSTADRFDTLFSVAVAVALVTGLLSLGRRWVPFVAFLGSAWLGVVAASLVAGWPMTPERVNLPLFLFVYVTTIYGGIRLASLAARELPVVAVAVSVLAVVLSWPTQKTELFGDAFLRGLSADLELVANSPADENLVFTYHFAARWYAEDALVTTAPGGRSYSVVPETYTDRTVYDPDFVAEQVTLLPAGSAVWCVIPFDAGPEASAAACPVPSGLTPIIATRAERSIIRGYLKP